MISKMWCRAIRVVINSLSFIDELGNCGAIKGCWGSCENTLHSREVPWQPCEQESAMQLAINRHCRIEGTRLEIPT